MPAVSWDQMWSSVDKAKAKHNLTSERDRLEGEVKELKRIGETKTFRGQASGIAETYADVLGYGQTETPTYLERQAGGIAQMAIGRANAISEMAGGQGIGAMIYGLMDQGATFADARNLVAEQYNRARDQNAIDQERAFATPLDVQRDREASRLTLRRAMEDLPAMGVDLAATVGLGTVNPALGMAYYGTTAGADAFSESMKRQIAEGKSPAEAYNTALHVGLAGGVASAAMESVPLGIITKGMSGVPKAIRGAVTSASRSLPEGLQPTMGRGAQRLLEHGTSTLAASATEALEEGGEAIAGRIARKFIEQDPAAFEGLGEEITTSMAYGGAMGGAARGGYVAGAEISTSRNRQRYAQYRQFTDEVASKLNDPASLEDLYELASKETPSRKDFKNAGLTVKASGTLRARMTENLRANLPPPPAQTPEEAALEKASRGERGLAKIGRRYEQQILDESTEEAKRMLAEEVEQPTIASKAAGVINQQRADEEYQALMTAGQVRPSIPPEYQQRLLPAPTAPAQVAPPPGQPMPTVTAEGTQAAAAAPPAPQPVAVAPAPSQPSMQVPTSKERLILRTIGAPPDIARTVYDAAGITPEEVRAVMERVSPDDLPPASTVAPPIAPPPTAAQAVKKSRGLGKKKAQVPQEIAVPEVDEAESPNQLEPAEAKVSGPASTLELESPEAEVSEDTGLKYRSKSKGTRKLVVPATTQAPVPGVQSVATAATARRPLTNTLSEANRSEIEAYGQYDDDLGTYDRAVRSKDQAKVDSAIEGLRQSLPPSLARKVLPMQEKVTAEKPQSRKPAKKIATKKEAVAEEPTKQPEISEPTEQDIELATLADKVTRPGRDKEQKTASQQARGELIKRGVTLEEAEQALKQQWAVADRKVRIQRLQRGRVAKTGATNKAKVDEAQALHEPIMSATREKRLAKLRANWGNIKEQIGKPSSKKRKKSETISEPDELIARLKSKQSPSDSAVEFLGDDIVIDGKHHNLRETAAKRLRLDALYVSQQIGEKQLEDMERAAWDKGKYLGLVGTPHWRVVLDTLTVEAAEANGVDLSKDASKEVMDKATKRLRSRDMVQGAVSDVGFSTGFGALDTLIDRITGQNQNPGDEFKRKARNWARSRGDLPQVMFDAHVEATNFVKEAMARAGFLAQDLFKAAKLAEGFRGKRLPKELQAQINSVLAAEQPSTILKPELRPAVQAMRNYMDKMSLAVRDYVRERMRIPPNATKQTHPNVNWKLYDAITANLGRYMHRSFQAFDDPHWDKKVTEKVKQDVRDWMRQESQRKIDETVRKFVDTFRDLDYKQQQIKMAKANGLNLTMQQLSGVKAPPNFRYKRTIARSRRIAAKRAAMHQKYWMTDSMIEGAINTILQSAKEKTDTPTFFRRILGSQDLTILRHRKDIPEPILRLLGEYKDLTNYAKTIAKTSQLVANNQFLKRVVAEGRGVFVFAPEDKKTTPSWASSKIGKSTTTVLKPLAGYKTHPDILKAIKNLAGGPEAEGFWKWYYMFEYTARQNVTVRSPKSIVRNFKSNILTLVANGHMPIWPHEFVTFGKEMAEAVNVLQAIAKHGDPKSWVTGNVDKKLRKHALLAVKHGIIGESVTAGVMADLPGAQRNIEKMREGFDRGTAGVSKIVTSPLAGLNKLSEIFYAGGDDFFKYLQWKLENNHLRKAHPELTAKERLAKSAQRVRNTNATYSLLPSVAKAIKNMPFGLFWAYKMEQVRNIGNRATLYKEEREGNAYDKRMALRRAFGQAAAASFFPVMWSSLFKLLSDVSDDDEDKIRRFLPWFMQDSTLIHLARSASGNYVVQDEGYADPWSFAMETVRAFQRGKDWEEKVANAGRTLLEPFASESLVLAAYSDIARNVKKVSGGQVYNEYDDPSQIGYSMIEHMAKLGVPGYVKQAYDVYRGYRGVSIGRKHYDMGTEVKSIITGNRAAEVDVINALPFLANDYASGLRSTANIILTELNNTGAKTESEIKGAYQRSEKNRRQVFDKFSEDVKYAIDLGVSSGRHDSVEDSTAEVVQTLKNAGRSDVEVRRLMAGEYEPLIPSGVEAIEKMIAYATPKHAELLEDARLDKVGNLAYQMTSPGKTTNADARAKEAERELQTLGVSDDEAADAMVNKWQKQDQKRENDRAEKLNERRARFGSIAGKVQPRTVTAPKLGGERGKRLRELGLTGSEIHARFGRRR